MKIIDFWAEWCGPCRMLAPVLKSLEEEYHLEVERINVDETDVAKYGVQSIPTLIIMDNEIEVQRLIGYRSKATIVKELGLDAHA